MKDRNHGLWGENLYLAPKKTIYGIEQKVTIDWNVDNNRLEQ